MKTLYLTLLLATLTCVAGAQCSGNRYTKQIFSSVDLTSDILYGNNVTYTGASEDLYLDVYRPSGDTETMRPLVILEHGGSFVGGSKTDGDVVSLAQDFAKMGYVCSSISYRIGMTGIPFPGPDSVTATEAVIRAYHDMKAAIRFFWKDARENGNVYGIDTNNIFIGGSSAGGFAAVHVAYLDDLSEMPNWVDTTTAGLGGGLAGQSGNPGYPSDIKAVFSLAGALRDTSWITPGDEPLLSMHATNDGTVPYGTDIISVLVYDIIVVSGSYDIHTRLNNVGVTNCFYSVDGSMHPVHNGGAAYYDTTVMYMRNFLSSFVCSTSLNCFDTDGIVGIDEVRNPNQIKIYPNPAKDKIYIDITRPSASIINIQIMDVLGNIVATTAVSSTSSQIDVSGLSPGAYLFVCSSANWQSTKRFIKK